MAYVKARGVWMPSRDIFISSGLPAAATTVLDAAADRWSAVFKPPKAGTIEKVRIVLGAVTKDATTEMMASFQTVSMTDGNPSGTETYFRIIPNAAIVANDFLLTGKITDDGTDTGAEWTVTTDTQIAVSMRISTFVAADSVAINSINITIRDFGMYTNYIDENLTGTYAKSTTKIGMLTLFYSDGSVEEIDGFFPAMKFATQSYNNTSTPDEYGLRFSLPYASKVSALWAGLDMDGDTDLVIYNAAGLTNLGSYDKDVRGNTLSQAGPMPFTAEQTIAINTEYIVALRPTSATSIIPAYADVAAQIDWNAWGGQELYGTSAKNPATTADFTPTVTRRYMMGLKLSALDDGASAGGGEHAYPFIG